MLMPLETPPSIWCVHQLTPKTSCSQEDLRNPSGFETMDGSANSIGAMVLMVAFFEFADINYCLNVCIQLWPPEKRMH